MESNKLEYCRDRCFPTKHIPFPQTFLLDDDLEVSVNYARTNQLPDVLSMIELAEKRGDNVGVNEFSNNIIVTDYILNGSEIFAVTNLKTQTVDAFILLHQCIYIRGYDTCLGTIRILRAASLGANDVAYGSLVRLATDFAAKIDYGYTHVIIDVALCLTNLLRVLKSLEFMITAVIPSCVNIVGFGVVENAILIKSLGISDRRQRSLPEIQNMLRHCCPSEEFMANYPTMKLPQVEFLSQIYTFRSGVQAIVRNMKKEDDEMMFELLNESAEKGEGFALTEYPSLDYFRMHFLASCYSIIVEEVDTKEMIGLILLSSSWYHRLGDVKVHFGGDMVLSRRYRGKGMGSEMAIIEYGIARELGFTSSVNDRFISNVQIGAAMKHIDGAVICGVLPNAGYVKNRGWEDALMEYANIPNAPTLTKLVQDSASNMSKHVSKL